MLLTSKGLPVQLSLLDEPAKHLRLHEDFQEAAYSLGRDGLAETLSLEEAGHRWGGGGGITVLPLNIDKELVVAHQLHKEADESLGDNSTEVAGIWGRDHRCVF